MGFRFQRNSSSPPLNPQRKRIAIVSALVACMAAPGAFLLRRYHTAQVIWLIAMIALLIYIGIELAKLRQSHRSR